MAVLCTFVGYYRKRLAAFGSDGAAVILGRKGGVAELLRESAPDLINNHCVAH